MLASLGIIIFTVLTLTYAAVLKVLRQRDALLQLFVGGNVRMCTCYRRKKDGRVFGVWRRLVSESGYKLIAQVNGDTFFYILYDQKYTSTRYVCGVVLSTPYLFSTSPFHLYLLPENSPWQSHRSSRLLLPFVPDGKSRNSHFISH